MVRYPVSEITDYDVPCRVGVNGEWVTHPRTGTATTAIIENLSKRHRHEFAIRALASVGVTVDCDLQGERFCLWDDISHI